MALIQLFFFLSEIVIPEHLIQTWRLTTSKSSTCAFNLKSEAGRMGVRSFGRSAWEESSVPQRVKKISWGLCGAQHLSLTMLDSMRISFHEDCEFGLPLETYR